MNFFNRLKLIYDLLKLADVIKDVFTGDITTEFKRVDGVYRAHLYAVEENIVLSFDGKNLNEVATNFFTALSNRLLFIKSENNEQFTREDAR